MKTEGDLHEKIRGWIRNTMVFFIICYALLTIVTLLYVPHMTDRIKAHPAWFALPLVSMLAIANIPREIYWKRDHRAFISSCVGIVTLMGLCAVGIFPNLVASRPDAANSLTVWNAASSQKTLKIMLTIATIGMPIVLSYTISIYWVFRGKVKLDSRSY
jgi:cytochrome d ubiquinol oxidase subunit II